MQSFCPQQLNCSDTSPLCPHCCHLLELTTTLSYYHNQLKEKCDNLNNSLTLLQEKYAKIESELNEKTKEVTTIKNERDQLYKDVDKVCSLNEQNTKKIQDYENKINHCSNYHVKQMKETQKENDQLKENLKNYSVLLEKFESNIHQRDGDLNKMHQLQEDCNSKSQQLEILQDQIDSFKKTMSLDKVEIAEKCEKLESENRDLMIQIENFLKKDQTDNQNTKSMFEDSSFVLPPFVLPSGTNTCQHAKSDLFDHIPGLKLDLMYDPVTPALSMCLGGYKFNRNDDHMRDSFAMLYEWIKEQHRHIMVASLCKQLYKYFDENTQIPFRKFIENCSSTINLLTVLLINSLSLHLSRGRVADAYILHAPISKPKNSNSALSTLNSEKQTVNHSAIKLMHEFATIVKDKHNCEIKPRLKNDWLNELTRNSFDETSGTIKNSELVCEFRNPHDDELICYRLMLMSPNHSTFVSSTNRLNK